MAKDNKVILVTEKVAKKKESISKITENKLQALQTDLFKCFEKCGSKCKGCKTRQCESYIAKMSSALTPYGESIFKKSFKFRATLEEMDRIVRDSIHTTLMDVWEKKRRIHTSFGAVIRWKMISFLDGKVNLFDHDRVQSLDQMLSEFTSNKEDDSDGADIIEFCSEALRDADNALSNQSLIIKNNTVDSMVSVISGLYDGLSIYKDPKKKAAIYIRSILGVQRFLEGKRTWKLFEGKPKARYYYNHTLDQVFNYLDLYRKLR